MGDVPQVLIFDAGRPDFARAERVVPVAGCAAFAPVWLAAGLKVSTSCRTRDLLSPDSVVQLTAAGSVAEKWPLPDCINGLVDVADLRHRHALYWIRIGYGTGGCDRRQVARVARFTDTGLAPVFEVNDTRNDVPVLAGW